MFTEPPSYIIFKADNGLAPLFRGLQPGEWPLSPRQTSIRGTKGMKTSGITRKQVNLVPGWAITDYKCQGQTHNSIVVDIRKSKAFSASKQYTSVYVQLSRCRSLSGLHLLAAINLADVSAKPPLELRAEFQRLRELERRTLTWWKDHVEKQAQSPSM